MSHFVSYDMTRASFIQWNDDNVYFVLDQHAEIVLYSVNQLTYENTTALFPVLN